MRNGWWKHPGRRARPFAGGRVRSCMHTIIIFLLLSVAPIAEAQMTELTPQLLWTDTAITLHTQDRALRRLQESSDHFIASAGTNLVLVRKGDLARIREYDPKYAPIAFALRLQDSSIVYTSHHLDDHRRSSGREDDFELSVRRKYGRIALHRIDLRTGVETMLDTTGSPSLGEYGFNFDASKFISNCGAKAVAVWDAYSGKPLLKQSSAHEIVNQSRRRIRARPGLEGVFTSPGSPTIATITVDTLSFFDAVTFDHLGSVLGPGPHEIVLCAWLDQAGDLVIVQPTSIKKYNRRGTVHALFDFQTKILDAINIGVDSILYTCKPPRTHPAAKDEFNCLLFALDLRTQRPKELGVLRLGDKLISRSSEFIVMQTASYALIARDVKDGSKRDMNKLPLGITHIDMHSKAFPLLISNARQYSAVVPATRRKLWSGASTGAVAVSSDGKHAASASKGEVELRNIRTGKLFGKIPFDSSSVEQITFMPNNKTLLVSLRRWAFDRHTTFQTRMHSVEDQKLLRTHLTQRNWRFVSPSPNGLLFGFGLSDTIFQLSTKGEATSRYLTGHTRPITTLRYSRDGGLLVSQDDAGSVGVWSLSDGQVRARAKFDPIGIEITRNGRYVLGIQAGNLTAYDLHEAKYIQLLRIGNIDKLALSVDGERLILTTKSGKTYFYAAPPSWLEGPAPKLHRQYIPLYFFLPTDGPQAYLNGQAYDPPRSPVRLEVLDASMNVKLTLIDGHLHNGKSHIWDLDVSDWPQGTYHKRLTVGNKVETTAFQVLEK